MIQELKLRKIGNSLGVVLPKESLARLRVKEGDSIYLTESSDGSLRVTPLNPDFPNKMKVAESVAGRYRNALRELEK